MWKVLVPHPHVVDKNLEGVSEEQGVPAPHQAPQPRDPMPGRCVRITPGCKNQQGFSRWKNLLDSQAVPLTGPAHGLTQIHSL